MTVRSLDVIAEQGENGLNRAAGHAQGVENFILRQVPGSAYLKDCNEGSE
jgi:hypothetical protein